MEMQGVLAEEIDTLDGYSIEFRKMYFLRNLIRTETELSGAIQNLLNNAEFRTLLEKQPPETQSEFQKGADVIGKAHKIAKEVRNDICGHVLESGVQGALERIDSEHFGLWVITRVANTTHYKFATELTAEILLKDMSPEERRKLDSSKFEAIADLVRIFSLIELCVLIYSLDRGLI